MTGEAVGAAAVAAAAVGFWGVGWGFFWVVHPVWGGRLGRAGSRKFATTDDAPTFEIQASLFFGEPVHAEHVEIGHL